MIKPTSSKTETAWMQKLACYTREHPRTRLLQYETRPWLAPTHQHSVTHCTWYWS